MEEVCRIAVVKSTATYAYGCGGMCNLILVLSLAQELYFPTARALSYAPNFTEGM